MPAIPWHRHRSKEDGTDKPPRVPNDLPYTRPNEKEDTRHRIHKDLHQEVKPCILEGQMEWGHRRRHNLTLKVLLVQREPVLPTLCILRSRLLLGFNICHNMIFQAIFLSTKKPTGPGIVNSAAIFIPNIETHNLSGPRRIKDHRLVNSLITT